jgi:hypothetical protein
MTDTAKPPDAPVLETGTAALEQHLNAIPKGKRGALVISFERSTTMLPTLAIGTAFRVNESWSVGADARLQKKAKPTTRFYTAISW